MRNIMHPLAVMGMFLIGLPLYSQVSFDKHSITQDFTDGMEVCPADINDDGHMDFVAAGRLEGGQVAWWENDGYEQFTKHVVENNLDGIRSIRAVDLDQDEDMDLVGCTVLDSDVLWWENDGDENFTMQPIDLDFTGAHTVAIYDVNGDSYLDVLSCGFVVSGPNPEVAWWENDGSQGWTKHFIDDRYQRHCSVDCGDFDVDGDLDIVSCGEQAGHIVWWEVDGTAHLVDTLIYGIHTVIAKDVDYDGDADLLGASCIGGKSHGTKITEMEHLSSTFWVPFPGRCGLMQPISMRMGTVTLSVHPREDRSCRGGRTMEASISQSMISLILFIRPSAPGPWTWIMTMILT